MDIIAYWRVTLAQDEAGMRKYFHENAWINWHNTNEHYTLDEFIRANCEYPGNWDGEVERVVNADDLMITATHVYEKDQRLSFHVVSFIKIQGDKILSIDEYWGDDGAPPQWRLDKKIGSPIM